ncbi:MAG: biopolymer transporter ExbD [Deferrisomatales bacterium]|nr:biopolymer transporter ExbD [Deferrisomatales bacterium]
MKRRHHYRRRTKGPPELNITSFLNLMVVLVPFLLIGAVFSRVTILELSMPTAAGGAEIVKPTFTIEVVVRKEGLELANGTQVVAALPKKDGDYDLDRLSQMLVRLKNDYPQKDDATVLMEPDIEYDVLIRVMDTVREAQLTGETGEEMQRVALFPLVSIGDAP